MTGKLQMIGNSLGVILNNRMKAHLGVQDEIEITMETGRIILSAPRKRQSFDDALRSTQDQYDGALNRIAEHD